MKNKTEKILAVLLAVIMLFISACIGSYAKDDNENQPLTNKDKVHVSGTKIYNENGEEVFFRGLNLGGWLIAEDWFTPVENNKNGDLYTMNKLTENFGADKAYELINIYQDNWLQETDFKNIADMGFNCVRIPFWYRNFQSDENGTWIRDEDGYVDLSRLEWAVNMCRKYGIYAILDLHGANGCQGYVDHCGLANSYHFFDQNEKGIWYRQQAVDLWQIIAQKFAGDPAVAMFDLLNEPMCNVSVLKRYYNQIWDFYDDCYKAIRQADPDRVMTMIGTWAIDKLPKPSKYGWTGVVYQYHQYDKKESDYTNRINAGLALNYGVPQYAGEFHPVGDKVNLDFAINAYNSKGLYWTLWTYKGYNSWAAGADWFVYGSKNNDLDVNLDNDSYDEIARKWGAGLQTNSGNYQEAQLYQIAKKYLPDATLDNAPFNTVDDLPVDTTMPPVTITLPTTVTTTEEQTTITTTTPTTAESTTITTTTPTTAESTTITTTMPTTAGSTTITTTPPITEESASNATTSELTTDNQYNQLEFINPSLSLYGDYILGVQSKTTPEQLCDMIKNGENAISSDEYVKTGMKLPFEGKTYTIIVDCDTNSDGAVTAADARLALRISANLYIAETDIMLAADADGDKIITAADARRILRKSAGLVK